MKNIFATLLLVTVLSVTLNGCSKEFLEENLSMIVNQSYPNIQVIISDHSKDDEIENFVNTFDKKNLELIYTRYTENYGNPCHNWNNALQYATGDYLHYLAMDDRFYDIDGIAPSLQAQLPGGSHIINTNKIRRLTPIECERLQTVKDNYTNHVSDSQRYKMLGNGWTVDVIAHIFKNIT